MSTWFRRVHLAAVVYLFLTGVMCGSASAQIGDGPMPLPTPSDPGGPTPLPAPTPPPPDPAIVGFSVEVIEDGLEYRFRFSGSIINCESLDSPVIAINGTPFNGTPSLNSQGEFSIEFVFSGDEGFGVLVTAHITDGGVRVSDFAQTFT